MDYHIKFASWNPFYDIRFYEAEIIMHEYKTGTGVEKDLYIDLFTALLIISLTSILIWKFARKNIYYSLLEIEPSVCALVGIIFGIGILKIEDGQG